MATNFEIDFLWVPASLGGHNGPPYEGMRLGIRWQKHLAAYLDCARDVTCTSLSFDAENGLGKARISMSQTDTLPTDWLHEGELVELLGGYRVLAVGRIISR